MKGRRASRSHSIFCCGSLGSRRRWRLAKFILCAFLAIVWITMQWEQYRFVLQTNLDLEPPTWLHLTGLSESAAIVNPNDNNQVQRRPPSATLNGIPIYHEQGVPQSSMYCVNGGLHPPTNLSWMFRSCQMDFLCLNVETHEYMLFLPKYEKSIFRNETHAMALGGINPRWTGQRGFDKGAWKVRWFPHVIDRDNVIQTSPWQRQGYYMLPKNHVLLPFHSMAAHNVGHLLWDDFLPIFSLLQWFGLLGRPLVPLRQHLDYPLYANCDIRKNKRQQCATNFERFWPLMGVDPNHFSTHHNVRLEEGILHPGNITTSSSSSSSTPIHTPLVCAQTAVAGLGMLTDHGLRDHGWDTPVVDHRRNQNPNLPPEIRLPPHNVGRGAQFAAFGEYLARHALLQKQSPTKSGDLVVTNSVKKDVVGVDDTTLPPWPRAPPVHITWSILSSRKWDRRRNFTAQMDYIRQHASVVDDQQQLLSGKLSSSSSILSSPLLHMEPIALWELSLQEQVALARRTHIFVTVCGGSAMTATFLPRGASVIVYYLPTDGFTFATGNLTGQPTRLDWDLLNNAGHLRVHFLPITSDMDEDVAQLDFLLQLISQEAETIIMLQEES